MKKRIKTRLPRYKRSKPPPPMRLTYRDKRLIEWVYLFRFLTRDQIWLLYFENASKTAKPLITYNIEQFQTES